MGDAVPGGLEPKELAVGFGPVGIEESVEEPVGAVESEGEVRLSVAEVSSELSVGVGSVGIEELMVKKGSTVGVESSE